MLTRCKNVAEGFLWISRIT